MEQITIRRDPNSGETVAQYGNARQVWRVQDGRVIEYSVETRKEYRGRMCWVSEPRDEYLAYSIIPSNHTPVASVPPVPETVDDVVIRYGNSFYS